MRELEVENVEVELTICPKGQDDNIEVTAEVELSEDGEHDILSVCDENGKDWLKELTNLDSERIIEKAEAKATIRIR